jgi:hypothetical protein
VVAREDVADRVVAHVPHVELPRGIGEHREAIELRLGRVLHGAEGPVLRPEGLCLQLDAARIVRAG